MSFSRTFHPVGQGAFYTEQHYVDSSVLTVVYDCGLLTPKKEQFRRKVATALPPGSVIDLLFLSHFHADHVNGLDELKKRYVIRTVVLPKLTEEARTLVKLENYVEYAGFSTLLVDNPRAYFGEQTAIILVEAIGEQGLVAGSQNLDAIPIAVLPQADQPEGASYPAGPRGRHAWPAARHPERHAPAATHDRYAVLGVCPLQLRVRGPAQ